MDMFTGKGPSRRQEVGYFGESTLGAVRLGDAPRPQERPQAMNRGAVIVPCAYCGRDMDVRDSWAVFGERACSPSCARNTGALHYGRVTDALVDELRRLEVRIQRFEQRT